MKKLTIIVCTYNREKDLKECLESIYKNNLEEDYEVLIVDNNSKDNTKNMVSEFQKARYVFEEKQGLSNARNRGILEARTEIIVFIDDDVIVEKNYVKEIINLFENKNVVCGGGRIKSIWKNERPNWFKEGFFSIIGETKYEASKKYLVNNEYPYGGNMFFRKSIFEEIGEFNPELGIKGEEIIMGEEVELCNKIRRKGFKLYYLDTAVVRHKVHLDKINKEYIVNRWKEEGKACAKIINGQSRTEVIKQKILRNSIIVLRDYPNYYRSKIIKKDEHFFYKAKLARSKEIIKNLGDE